MRWFVGLSVVALVAALALALSGWLCGMPEAKVRADHSYVASGRPGESPRRQREIQGIGYVEPASEVRRLVFKIDGVIGSCAVEVGQHVSRGAVLMSLANSEEAAALAVAERDLAAAVAERDRTMAGTHAHQIAAARSKVELVQTRLRYLKRHAQRLRALHKTKSVAESEHDEAENAVDQAEAELRQAQADLTHLVEYVRPADGAVADVRVAQADARLAAARAHLNETTLCAPSEGTVLEILRREGEAAGGPALIFADDSRLRLRAEIDERFVYWLRIGQRATAFGLALGEQRFVGRVALVKQLMGGKTTFSRSASERKDLDVLQVLIDMPEGFRAPLGLQVDVAIEVDER